MGNFIRRFLSDPGVETLLEIESVNILDLEPAASISGIGTGMVICVGEFENGPFAAADGEGPSEVAGVSDFLARFGGFGHTYDGVQGKNPCARKRNADAALNPEYWNGNGFISLVNKKFKRLVLARVDTSVGEVEFTRLACVSGSSAPTFDLEPAETLVYDLGTGAGLVTATFSAAVAQRDTAAGVFPTLFVGGEKFNVTIDEGTPQQIGPVDIVFQAADQTQAQVVSRVNTVLGYTSASVLGGGVTRMVGRVRGTGGNVKINSADAAVIAAIGVAVGATNGTGNVANIDAVTVAEVDSVIAGTDVRADRDAAGNLRLCNTLTPGTGTLYIDPTSTANGLGLTEGQVADADDGHAQWTSAAGVYPTLFAGGETVTLGFDGDVNVLVTFDVADQTQAQVISRVNTVLGFTAAASVSATRTKLEGRENGGQVRIVAASAPGVLTTLGFSLRTIDAVKNASGTIPAGTRVRNSSAAEWVTMQDVAVEAEDPGSYSVKVRPATDDGTALTSVTGSVTVVPFPIALGGFSCTNPLALSAALSEAAIDAAYLAAMDATRNLNNVAAKANAIYSARQSNVCRVGIRDNARLASSEGAYGRVGIIRPPLGVTRSVARSTSQQPGVGAYRDQRVGYAFPGVQTFVSQIAALGLAGGDGFTADGVIDVGFDAFCASVFSQLPPEENPGQVTAFLGGVLGIEAGNADVQDLTMADYIAFRESGIMAPRMDDGVAIIQSGVTSVNPLVYPNLRNVARRRMADFIQDSLALRLKSYGKKLNSRSRRALITQEVRAFMQGLVNDERIEGFLLDGKNGNTPETLALGIFRLILKARTISSMDSIVLETTVGEGVDINEAA